MPDRFASLARHALPLGLLLLACALAAGAKLHYLGITPNSDYASYLDTAQVFAGQPALEFPERLLKPLAPLVVTALASAFGYPIGFMAEMLVFYFAFAIAFYLLAYEFFASRFTALLAALLAALSYPMLHYGVDLYTETGAQFFYILSLILTLKYLKAPSKRLLIANALAIGVGFLWKEYSVVAGLAFGLALLFERIEWRAKAKNIAILAAFALLPTALVQVWVYERFHYTYLDWYRIGGRAGFKSEYTLRNLAKSVAAILGLAWLAVPWGLGKVPSLDEARRRFLLFTIPPTFLVFIWGFVSSRLFYVMATPAILLALLGLSDRPRWQQALVVALVLATDIAWLFHNFAPTPI